MGVRKFTTRFLFAAAALLLTGGAALPAQAAQGLQISPLRTELTAGLGQTLRIDVTLKNLLSQETVASVRADDFTANGEDGTISVSGTPASASSSIASWVSTVAPVHIAPSATTMVPVTIHVPMDASPGSHYGVVRFTPSEDATSASTFGASLATLVLLQVAGPVREELSLSDAGVRSNGTTKPVFLGGPLQLFERLSNTGTQYEKPMGTVTVRDWRGRALASLAVNGPEGAVLPGSSRVFTQDWNPPVSSIGRFTAEYDLSYKTAQETKTLHRTATFWILPRWLTYAAGILMLLVGAVLVGVIRRRHRHR